MDANNPKYQKFYQSLSPDQKSRFIEIMSQKDDTEGAKAAAARIRCCDRRSAKYAKIRSMRSK